MFSKVDGKGGKNRFEKYASSPLLNRLMLGGTPKIETPVEIDLEVIKILFKGVINCMGTIKSINESESNVWWLN